VNVIAATNLTPEEQQFFVLSGNALAMGLSMSAAELFLYRTITARAFFNP
jgi:hypothetical protein